MGKNEHYNAFISYRHSDLDSEIAAGIHKRLEAFSLPRNLRDRFPKEMHKIKRVFRDTEELPLADNLSDPINEALQNSDWLIVVCSPRLKESLWCAKEIELFSGYHGKDHILCVLAEGEPDDSFPEAIRFRERKVTDENGNEHLVKEPVEPLAADVRGASKHVRGKKMDDAILRMAAPMYGLGYDDLKQRHREQRVKRIAFISAVASAFFLLYAITSTVLTIRINNQKKIIEKQHTELEEQYLEQQIKYAQSMALVSGELLKKGRGQAAAYAVRCVMPGDESDAEHQPLASCRYALSNALGIYEADEFIPWGTMEIPEDDFWPDSNEYAFLSDHLGGYQVVCASDYDINRVLIVASSGHIYLYDKSDNTLYDNTLNFLAEEPSDYITVAAYKDDMLYILFSQASEVVCYKWKGSDGYEPAGECSFEERIEKRGRLSEIGEPVESDDGKYMAVQGDDHSLRIYKSSDKKQKECLKSIYDIRGVFCSMKKIEGTDHYLLIYSGKFSYLLDEDFNVTARVANFHDYSEKKKAFILYRYTEGGNDYELFYVPLLEYEDIIEMADEFIGDFEPSGEMAERYGLSDQKYAGE